MTVYLDHPEVMRGQWKVERDCSKRGYPEAEMLPPSLPHPHLREVVENTRVDHVQAIRRLMRDNGSPVDVLLVYQLMSAKVA